jgi:hypothetical protein
MQISDRTITRAAILALLAGALIGRAVALRATLDQSPRSQRTSAAVLSEHELEALNSMPAQAQAEPLLERAIPRLLDFAGDFGLDPTTRGWVFQALRDITGETMRPDPELWRAWYVRSGRIRN